MEDDENDGRVNIEPERRSFPRGEPARPSIVPEKPDEGLKRHNFMDSGKWVWLRKASPVLMMELRSKYPAPLPPKQIVYYEPDVPTEEFNETHPEYRRAVEQHEIMLETMMRKLLIKRSVVLPGEQMDQIRAEVEQLKQDWAAATEGGQGTALTGTIEFLYVSYICIGSDDDLQELIADITRSSFRERNGNSSGDPESEAEV